jgi:hypothetical protein
MLLKQACFSFHLVSYSHAFLRCQRIQRASYGINQRIVVVMNQKGILLKLRILRTFALLLISLVSLFHYHLLLSLI